MLLLEWKWLPPPPPFPSWEVNILGDETAISEELFVVLSFWSVPFYELAAFELNLVPRIDFKCLFDFALVAAAGALLYI